MTQSGSRNIWKKYLVQKETEIAAIMISFFDKKQIMKLSIKCGRHDTAADKEKELPHKAKHLQDIA